MHSRIITAENVVAGYRDKIVWRDGSFAIDRGEFVAVIGPNGAGKTTLFRLLLGLQQPISGTIKIFNARPKRGNPQIGYVPQRHVIDSETNIECLELVRLAISGKQWGFGLFSQNDRKTALDTLQAVGAAELAHRSLSALSGGELQRIFLAEALVSNPDILLLDEPLSNLDIRRAKELVQLVNNVVRSRNVTAFLVAHDINPLLPFLDNVIYIANGKVATGKPKEVLTSERLTALYEVNVEVMRDSKGNVAIIGAGTEDHHRNEQYELQH
jgi:zinc/manganese transport system ATP-binding protein